MAGPLLTQDFAKTVVDRLTDDTPTRSKFSQAKVGIGTTAVAETDTDLDHPIPVKGTELVDDCEATTGWTDSADMTVSLNTTTFKEGDASLNLTKDGTGSADASTSKTTTSRDFTSKELSIWLYITDSTALAKLATTDCVTIRFGSDGSNYYTWTKDASNLSTGWNLLDGLTVSNADSTTGTPTIAAMDYTFIQLTADAAATTWTAGDFAMDDIKVISSDDYFLEEVSGYPVIDLTNYEVTHRFYLNTVRGNGYFITEIGEFNSDSTPLLGLRSLTTGFSKSLTDELIIITKKKLRINTLT